MSAATVLTEAEAAGLTFRLLADGRLRVTGTTPLEFIARLWERRAELIAALQARASSTPAPAPIPNP